MNSFLKEKVNEPYGATSGLLIANAIVAVILWHHSNELLQIIGLLCGFTSFFMLTAIIGLLLSHGDPGINFIQYLLGAITQAASLLIPLVVYPLPYLATVSFLIGLVTLIRSKSTHKALVGWGFILAAAVFIAFAVA